MVSSEEVIKKLILEYVENRFNVHNNAIQVYWDYRDRIEDSDSLREVYEIGVSCDDETFDGAMLDFMYEHNWEIEQWDNIFENLDFDECMQIALEDGRISEEDFEYYESLDFSDIRDIVQENFDLDLDPDHFNCDVIVTLRFDGHYSDNYFNRLVSDDNEDFYTFDDEGRLKSPDSYYFVSISTDAYKFYELYKQYNSDTSPCEIVFTNCDIAINDEDEVVAYNKTVVFNRRLIRELDDLDVRID